MVQQMYLTAVTDAVQWDACVLAQSVSECPARPYIIKC